MTDITEINQSTGHANTIFNAMTAGVDLTIPEIDLSGALYTPPDTVNNPLYTPPVALTTEDLTAGTLDGNGLFDVLMKALNNHFAEQYNQGRITGADYAKAYVGATQGALSTAVQ